MNIRTICNPINISYQYQGEYHSRESADPAVAVFKNEYYLFASHGSGYWVSKDLAEWEFIPVDLEKQPEFKRFAPGPCVVGDRMYITHSEGGDILWSDNPRDGNSWVNIGKPYGWGDPALFYDDDGYVYVVEGLSDRDPIHVAKLDPNDNMKLVEGPVSVCCSDKANRGFERSGDNNENDERRPYFEGGWLNKYNGRYYLTYAVPGTEFATYADGCFVADNPMGPYTFCDNSPVIFKSTGFMRGSGHGCLFEDLLGRWWKIDTNAISVNHMFERRIALYPAKFGEDGRLYTNTIRADYPMLYPHDNPAPFDKPTADWHLLSFGKAVSASSVLDEKHQPGFAADENMSTWWSAKTGDPGEWLTMDLGKLYDVCAVQINFADQDADASHGRNYDYCYRYTLEISEDGENWTTLINRCDDPADLSHDYFQLDDVTKIRALRLTNRGSIPANGKFAVSGLRIFGFGGGKAPERAPDFTAVRCEDTRNMTVTWDAVDHAQGYIIRLGVNPDERHTHYQIIGKNSADIGCLNRGVTYYVSVDAYNESGITEGFSIVKVKG